MVKKQLKGLISNYGFQLEVPEVSSKTLET